MVNTRAKIKKTQNTVKHCFLEAAMADSDHLAKQSGALIGSNDDLLIEILLRLPVTSVLRFRSVSKHWRSLLSHRPFTLLYKNASISPGFFVHNLYIPFDGENQSAPSFPNFNSYPDPLGIRIVQSCNGLLLCCGKQGIQRDRKYYVLNPTTRQISAIPSVPGGRNVRKTIRFMGLAFHPTDCVHYKVVCFHRAKPDEDLFRIQIYLSDTGKWKISEESFSFSALYYATFGYGVYWNQAIHWDPFSVNPSYFKLDTEKVQPLPKPVRVASFGRTTDGAMPLYFGESRGHLHFAVRASESHLQVSVYEMLNDHSGWFLKYEVELDELSDAYPYMIRRNRDPLLPSYYEFQLLDLVRGEEEDEAFMVIRIPGNNVIRYNVADKSFKEIYNLSTFIAGPIAHSEVHRYVETIVSL